MRVPTDQFLFFGRVGSYDVRTPVQTEQKKAPNLNRGPNNGVIEWNSLHDELTVLTCY